MTSVRPVGAFPTGPILQRPALLRGPVFAASGVLAALNAQADQIISSFTYLSPSEVVTNMAGISAVIWAAMVAAWKIGADSRRPMQGMLDTAVAIVVVLLSFTPVSYAAQGGLLLCACYMLISAGNDGAERRSALVLLALTGPLIWGRLFLHLFEVPILSLDAHLVGSAIGTKVDGNVVQFVRGGGHFIIGGPCSSVHNMSLAIVLWTTVAMLFRIRIDRAYIAIGIAMMAFMFSLNVVRLSAMGMFPDWFDFLHFGDGAAVFGWLGLIGAGLLAASGVTHAVARQR